MQDILSDKKRVSRPKLQDGFFATMGIGEHLEQDFLEHIFEYQECSKCSICARNCSQTSGV